MRYAALALLASALVVFPVAGSDDAAGPHSAADIAEAASKATVAIRCRVSHESLSSGSGFIVDSSGVIVTNHHVVEGCQQQIQVKLENGDTYEVVSVYALDTAKDLAILRIPGFKLPVLPLGDSDTVRKGDRLLAVGNPLGLEGSVSDGILSGVRELEGFRVFQTDAAVSPGSSGGPVLNTSGDVVGVTSFKIVGGESLNFAVPVNYVRGLLVLDTRRELASLSETQDPGLFTKGDTAFSSRWRSLETGDQWEARRDGDRIYLDLVPDADEEDVDLHVSIELQEQGGEWKGTRYMSFSCRYGNGSIALPYRWSRCRFESDVGVTSLTPARIEGWIERLGKRFKCKRCAYTGDRYREDHTLVPD